MEQFIRQRINKHLVKKPDACLLMELKKIKVWIPCVYLTDKLKVYIVLNGRIAMRICSLLLNFKTQAYSLVRSS